MSIKQLTTTRINFNWFCFPKTHQLAQKDTVNCKFHGSLTSLMQSLLPNKTRAYFEQLLAEITYLMPKTLVTDFEAAIFNDAEKNFTGVEIECYLCHLGQRLAFTPPKNVFEGCNVNELSWITNRQKIALFRNFQVNLLWLSNQPAKLND